MVANNGRGMRASDYFAQVNREKQAQEEQARQANEQIDSAKKSAKVEAERERQERLQRSRDRKQVEIEVLYSKLGRVMDEYARGIKKSSDSFYKRIGDSINLQIKRNDISNAYKMFSDQTEKTNSLLNEMYAVLKDEYSLQLEELKTQRQKAKYEREDELEQKRRGGYGSSFVHNMTTPALGRKGFLFDTTEKFFAFLLNPKVFLSAIGISGLVKALSTPMAGLAIAIGMKAIDAVNAYVEGESRNTDNIVSAIAGFLAGDGKNDMLSKFKVIGGWTAIGATIGAGVGGPVGILAGALIGTAIGIAMDALGPEFLADKIQGTVDTFQKTVDAIFGTKDYFNEKNLDRRIKETQAVIDTKNSNLNDTAAQLDALRQKYNDAMKSGDDALQEQIQTQIDDLVEFQDGIKQDIQREQSKLKTFKDDKKKTQEGQQSQLWGSLRDAINFIAYGTTDYEEIDKWIKERNERLYKTWVEPFNKPSNSPVTGRPAGTMDQFIGNVKKFFGGESSTSPNTTPQEAPNPQASPMSFVAPDTKNDTSNNNVGPIQYLKQINEKAVNNTYMNVQKPELQSIPKMQKVIPAKTTANLKNGIREAFAKKTPANQQTAFVDNSKKVNNISTSMVKQNYYGRNSPINKDLIYIG